MIRYREVGGHRSCDVRIILLFALGNAITEFLVYTYQQAGRLFVARNG